MHGLILLFATGCNGCREPDALTPLDPYLPGGKTPVGFARYEDLRQADWPQPEVTQAWKRPLLGHFFVKVPNSPLELAFVASRASEADPWVYENLLKLGICPEESIGELAVMGQERWGDPETTYSTGRGRGWGFDDAFPPVQVSMSEGTSLAVCNWTSTSKNQVNVSTRIDDTSCVAAIGRLKTQDLGLAALIDTAPECEEYWDQVD